MMWPGFAEIHEIFGGMVRGINMTVTKHTINIRQNSGKRDINHNFTQQLNYLVALYNYNHISYQCHGYNQIC